MKTKRILSLLLTFLMVFTMVPDTAFAGSQTATEAPKELVIGVKETKRHVVEETKELLVGVPGDTFEFVAYDENGKETPVTWSGKDSYAGEVDATGTFTIGEKFFTDLNAGMGMFKSPRSVKITAVSTLDPDVSVSKNYDIASFKPKNETVSVKVDPNYPRTITATAGLAGYCSWTYDEEAAKGVAEPAEEATTGKTWKFNVYRPGSFTATATATFDETLSQTVTLNVTGVSVEDENGTRGTVYINRKEGEPDPTLQLKAFVQSERTVESWSSSKESVAEVSQNGLVTAKGIGTTQITVRDSGGETGAIRVAVREEDGAPCFDELEFYSYALDNWVKGSTFEPRKLEYDLNIKQSTTSSLTIQDTTLYDTERYTAVANYTDSNGNAAEIPIGSGKQTILPDIPFGSSDVTLTVAEKNDPSVKTEYVFHVTRPRSTVKKLGSQLIVRPETRDTYANAKYKGYAEGTYFEADETGTVQTKASASLYSNSRTYLLNSERSFYFVFNGGTSFYAHVRYSTDDGASWKEVQNGDRTDVLTMPEGKTEAKVRFQVLDDATYYENRQAGKDGFAEGEPTEYTVWVESVETSLLDAGFLSYSADADGDWYPEQYEGQMKQYAFVTSAEDVTSAAVTFKAATGASVTIAKEKKEADENGQYTFPLTNKSSVAVTITSEDELLTKDYNFTLRNHPKNKPDKVVDYLVPYSQYGSKDGRNTIAVVGEGTLDNTAVTLGGFGGYISYYYDEPLKDDPKNPYGVDFFVYGNANVDTTTPTHCSFFEPGQVWVSENGTNWYALAGSEHYEKSTVWDYEVTYTRTSDGNTAWTDNQGNSNPGNTRAVFPNPGLYYKNSLIKDDQITLKGICLANEAGDIASHNVTCDASHVSFGYADCFANGTFGAAVNPYQENEDKTARINGFDLAWAVDEAGNPVDVSDKEFHYVKVVTASNMWHSSFYEKSTETFGCYRADEGTETVGKTADAASVTFTNGDKKINVPIDTKNNVYEVNVDDMKYVSVQVNGTDAEDNIYVNNQRIAYNETADGIKVTKEGGETLVRVIVQKGEMEPELYLFKLTGTASESDELIEGVRVKVNESSRYISTNDGVHYALDVSDRIEKVSIDPIVKKGVTYTIYKGSDTSGEAPEEQEQFDLAYGKNVFTIQAEDEKGGVQTVSVEVNRAEKPVLSGDEIRVSLALYGDEKHGSDASHTYWNSRDGLKEWIAPTEYTVPKEATVLDVLEKALGEKEMAFTNADGNYISAINGLSEFDNGALSGWMFMVNGKYPAKGVAGQTLENGDEIVFHYTDDYTKEHAFNEEIVRTAEEVEALIAAIGDVTLNSGSVIAAARTAYDGLSEDEKGFVANYNVLTAAEAQYAALKAQEDAIDKQIAKAKEIYEATGAYMEALTPGTGMVGGEWLVLGLARAGKELSPKYRAEYLKQVQTYVRENCDENNRISRSKSTENSRIVLALTALGYDPAVAAGRDLLAGLSDMEYLKKQGINGPIWALLAFDSKDYEIPALQGDGVQVTRDGLIEEILNAQLADGGFALAGKTAEAADADLTGMALQALAPYRAREDVKAAIDKALSCLSKMQLKNGGYASWGTTNMESCAQVLGGLSALGIDAARDERFVKDGNSLLDAITSFALPDGSFAHAEGDTEGNQMTTEQAYYGLTAYFRMLEEKTSLYDMSDVEEYILCGDVNGDGRIASDDALAILKRLAGIKQDLFVEKAGDCDGTPGITTSDALAILKYMAHLIPELPVAD